MEKQRHLPLKHLWCLVGGILLVFVSVLTLPKLFSPKAQATTAATWADKSRWPEAEKPEETLVTKAQDDFWEQAKGTADIAGDNRTGNETTKNEEMTELLSTEKIWQDVYHNIIYEEGFSADRLLAMALALAQDKELQLLSTDGDHLVNYGGKSFVITEDDYQVLLRIVESEAPSEDVKGKMLVANVVLNRVLWEDFPDTVGAVVFQKGQFAPIASGYYWRVDITESTIEAVERALAGEDESKGALFFMAREQSKPKNVKWFDTALKFLFKYGEHEFFTVK